jgi:hypothetical protein
MRGRRPCGTGVGDILGEWSAPVVTGEAERITVVVVGHLTRRPSKTLSALRNLRG